MAQRAQGPRAARGPAGGIDHTHRDLSGGWLRPAVFGAMDGLVTNISLIAGVGGGGANRTVIILSGFAGLVAGAFSMAMGEYSSVETQNNALRAEAATEKRSLEANPTAEQAELTDVFVERGLSRPTAELVAAEVHRNPELALRVHLTTELGVDPTELPSPFVAALSSFLCFAVGGFIPLITFVLGSSSLLLGLLVGAAGLFVAGALVSRFTTRGWLVNGARQLAFGTVAAAATYGVGTLIGVSIS